MKDEVKEDKGWFVWTTGATGAIEEAQKRGEAGETDKRTL